MFSLGQVAKEIHLRIDQGDESGVPPLTRSGVYEILKGTFDVISQAVAAGESVTVPKFGKFEPVIRDKRKGRNPKTGETIDIPERMSPKFRPSSALREKVANGDIKALKAASKKPAKKASGKSAKKKKK